LLLLWIGAKIANMIFEYGFRRALPLLQKIKNNDNQTSYIFPLLLYGAMLAGFAPYLALP